MGVKYIQIRTDRCLKCGSDLSEGRRGRKFCSPKCRYEYHNDEARDDRIIRTRTFKSLDRNYSILLHLLKAGLTDVPLQQAVDMGFDPTRVSAFVRTRDHLELSVFDIRYRQTATRLFSIEKISLSLPRKSRQKDL